MNDEKHERGLATRREVLGDEYVDRALSTVGEFNQPLQDLLNESCWGTLWTREQLPRSTRSLVTVAILTSLRATTELKAHVRGALRNGCTPEEIREVLLHATGYCGFPAGVEAFRAAREVIDAWEG